jgi:predicted adenylyl cyclase CyaB
LAANLGDARGVTGKGWDNLETELKIEVEDHDPVRRRLEASGATFESVVDEMNVYLDRDGELRSRHESLRLRQDQRVRLTWKGPSKADDGVVQRPEIEVEVANLAATADIFQRLGFSVVDRLAKRRETWRLANVEIALDTLAFGRFVEIEGEPGAARSAAAQLGLDASRAITRSYRFLQAERETLPQPD